MTRRKLRLIAALAATALAAPAFAQIDHSKMNMPGTTMPAPAKKPPKKATPSKPRQKATAKAAPAIKAPAKKAVTRNKPTPAKAKPVAAVDPHAGHDMVDMPAQPADSMAGHDMTSMPDIAPAGTDLPAGNAPPPPVPTDHAADAIYRSAMDMSRHHLATMHGAQKFSQVMLNIAEYQVHRGRDGFEWDGEAWVGGDINRLWLKSEGEGEIGRPIEKAEVQALYSRAVDPYFNLQGGLRYDLKPDPSRVYAVVGAEGLAPYFFDMEGALFLSNKGELLARAEGYYDQRITQRLILQPRAELNFAAQNSRVTLTGAGLSDAEIGLRLRYDIKREFAPYFGVQYRRAFGKTRDYLREAGERSGGLSLLTGVRTWF